MKKAMALLLTLCLLCPAFSLAGAQVEQGGKMRALLIGCDAFLTQENTWPAADNNLHLLSDTFLFDSRNYQLIRCLSGNVATVADFEAALTDTFAAAEAGDTALLYISTHGVFSEGASVASAALVLSDGEQEELLSAAALQAMLDKIPGQKVLILDACNAGAFIGKGLSGGADRVFFSGPDYKVLCSAGGSEASWYWHGTEDAQSSGASYFATVLANALSAKEQHAADSNLDGLITLSEVYSFLINNYAASTPQVYPQQDDFVLYAYDRDEILFPGKTISDISFDDTLLTAGVGDVSFSFTVHRQTELYYQIVYHENGSWQFGIAQHYRDEEQADGTVVPGRKQRTLSLDTGSADAYGYAMIQLITLEEGRPVYQGGCLLTVQPAVGELKLAVTSGRGFSPGLGQEMCIMVQHDVPCGLTVNICNAAGENVRRLAYAQPSRPQQLSPAGSTFYWDGRRNDGTLAEPGDYTAQVRVRLGDKTYLEKSAPFTLLMQEARPAPSAEEAIQ